MYRAELTELRTELQVLQKNDFVALKSESESILRELEYMNQRLKEEVANLRAEFSIEMNNRKADIRDDAKLVDMQIQELNSKLSVETSNIKTELESMKLDVTRSVAGRLHFCMICHEFALQGMLF
jgi:predicted transport protein